MSEVLTIKMTGFGRTPEWVTMEKMLSESLGDGKLTRISKRRDEAPICDYRAAGTYDLRYVCMDEVIPVALIVEEILEAPEFREGAYYYNGYGELRGPLRKMELGEGEFVLCDQYDVTYYSDGKRTQNPLSIRNRLSPGEATVWVCQALVPGYYYWKSEDSVLYEYEPEADELGFSVVTRHNKKFISLWTDPPKEGSYLMGKNGRAVHNPDERLMSTM